ncbi:MAG: phosphodiester glycosidase family protein [Luteitalea sp.]|nr:phosphodiester glycosidase family protein [Luteitalea sp.]
MGAPLASLPTEAASGQWLAPGVTYESLDVTTPRGTARAHIVEADLWNRRVLVDLLYPGVVAERQPLSDMADERHAVAGVNGDFFNISVTQPDVVPTDAPVGPAKATGMSLKAAVPTSQRFGPSLPPGTTVEDVLGVGADRVGRLGRLTLRGRLSTPYGAYDVRGLNQYALAEGGIGAFNAAWGDVSRKRAICGTDERREDPCSLDVHEVTVRQGEVVAVSTEPGAGSIPKHSVVLLGREEGASTLRLLQVGDQVHVSYYLASSERVPFLFAVGGHPILRDGAPLPGLDDSVAAVRSGAGVSANGRKLFLLALDRNAAGMTYAELAALLLSRGAASGVNLDGGGSSTLVAREPGASEITVKNLAPGDFERPVPNGIGVLTVP